jgi:threonine synthase
MSEPKSIIADVPPAPNSGWNARASLRCVFCGAEAPIGTLPVGCQACDAQPAAPLEVVYDDAGFEPEDLNDAIAHLRQFRQPIEGSALVSLGRSASTPLVPVPKLGPDLWVKNETTNATWSHKDRTHEVSVGAARLLGSRGVVASSTGNHGAAAAAHATKAGLPSLVFCHPDASDIAMLMIRAYGGVVAQLSPDDARQLLSDVVDDGWFPATTMDPAVSVKSNPYGAEGYKSIAYEVVEALQRLPATVLVPSASGDTLYGVMKGFAEVAELVGGRMPRIVGVQPTGAAPLILSMEVGHSVRVDDAKSVALSIADPFTGRHALIALQRWGGSAVAVTDDSIVAAVKALAAEGLLVEPASAAGLAGYWDLRDAGQIDTTGPTVLLVTNSGAKWPRELAEEFPGSALRTSDEVRAELQRKTTLAGGER